MGSIPKKDMSEDTLAQEEESLGLGQTLKPAPSPNFDPPFANDVRLPERGFLKGMMHFVNKNADNLSRSIFDRVVSPIKFANCVNNYSELRRRHRRLMELEAAEYSPGRVRFVNYYTTSTGRKTKTKPAQGTECIDRAEYIEHTTTTSSQDPSEAPSVFSESEAATSMTSDLTLEGQDILSTCSSSTQPFDEVSTEKDHLSMDITSTASSTSLNQEKSHHIAESISTSASESGLSAETPKQKLRRFILLPSDHWKRNNNSHWTPVLMENMDEVTAHQSIFIPQGANYDHLVGDMVALIEQWVQSDLSRRLLQESLD